MPIIQDFACDVKQEMNWVKGINTVVGYVNSISIAGKKLPANMTNLWDPIKNTNTLSAVGVMEYAGWDGGSTEPVRLSFAVKNDNQIALLNLLANGLSDTEVSIEFTVYNFDQSASPPVYYQTCWTNEAAMTGIIAKEGSILALEVERERRPDIVSPNLFNCHLAFAPTPGKAQKIYLANSSTAKYVSVFGTA
jgi:hypothetical protein